MREIKLSKNQVALVDDDDFDALNSHKWHATWDGHRYYVRRYVGIIDGVQTREFMHRLVLSTKLGRGLAKSEKVDHKNGDGLDNRKSNLRLATSAQNASNCRKRAACLSKFIGVTWCAYAKKWKAAIKINGKSMHLGRRADELDAAYLRERFICLHPELMAKPNFDGSSNGR
jgi:hypothetical protein